MSLRYSLPAAIAVALLVWMALLGLSFADTQARHRQLLLQTAQADALRQARTLAHLARLAHDERNGPDSPLSVGIAAARADPRVQAVVLTDPQARVQQAHRPSWLGAQAPQVLPGFPMDRFARVARGGAPEAWTGPDPRHLSVMLPQASRQGASRDAAGGVVYLAYDLGQPLAQLRQESLRQFALLNGGVLLMLLAVWMVLHRRLAQPLLRLERAARQMILSQAVDRVPENRGSNEMRRLTRNFNSMIAHVRQTQTALESSRSHLASIIDSAMDGIVTTDGELRVRVFNPAAARMFGYSEAEIVGQPLEHLIPTPQRGRHAQLMRDFAASHADGQSRRRNAVVQGQRRNGERFPVEVSISHETIDGQPLFLAIVRDVTERLRAEAEIQALANSLELRVHQRTSALAEANARLLAQEIELREAKALAEENTRLKSDFLANMSHEIRTPLNSVIGLSHLALQHTVDPRQQDYLRKIERSGQHLLRLIDDILDFSKIEANKMQLEQTGFELCQVLDGFAHLIAQKASDKGLALAFHVADDVPRWLIGDPLRLSQMLINYGNNAVKFTHQGEIELRVRTQGQAGAPARDGGQALLRFEMRDTGIGIAPDQIGRLFQSFHQADGSISRQYGGTGLGLAIVRRLARLMGGEAGVDSQPGVGSTFWFTARFGLGTPPARSPAPDARPTPLPAPGARVLLVEDNDINQQVASELLRALGLTVDVADNGQQALQRLADTDYALVLMDMQMPVMDGLDATRALRAQARWRDLPVVAMTANATAADRQRCLAAGMNDFVTKPVNPERLRQVLGQWLSPDRAR